MAWVIPEKDLLHIRQHGVDAENRNGATPMTVHQKPNTLQLESFCMPFTANRQCKAAPRPFASAQCAQSTTGDGRKVIDGSAGLWCVNAGHGRRQIAAAVERQLMNIDFAPSSNMGHP